MIKLRLDAGGHEVWISIAKSEEFYSPMIDHSIHFVSIPGGDFKFHVRHTKSYVVI